MLSANAKLWGIPQEDAIPDLETLARQIVGWLEANNERAVGIIKGALVWVPPATWRMPEILDGQEVDAARAAVHGRLIHVPGKWERLPCYPILSCRTLALIFGAVNPPEPPLQSVLNEIRDIDLPAGQKPAEAPSRAIPKVADLTFAMGKVDKLERGEISIASTTGVSAAANKQRIYVNEELDKLNAELAAGKEAEAKLEQARLLLGVSETSLRANDTPQATPAAAGEVTASSPIPTAPKPAFVQAARNRKKMTQQETEALAGYRARNGIPESGDKQFADYTKLCATDPDMPPLKRWMFRTTKAKSGPKSSPRNSRQK